MRTLTEDDGGREVTLRPDEDAVVEFAENATTGFRWTAAAGGDCVAVHDQGSRPAGAAAPGAAGTHTFRLRAAAPGTCDVEFRLRRSWESDQPPERTVTIRVRVG